MSLTVEDGTNVAGADSYISVADADTYFLNRNNTTWDAADIEDKEKALREATQYIDGAYDFLGYIVNTSQSLLWPRNIGYDRQYRTIDIDEIPQKLKDAVCELALAGLSESLLPAVDRETQREKVGSLEVTYFQGQPSKSYPFVGLLLRDLTCGSNRLTRV